MEHRFFFLLFFSTISFFIGTHANLSAVTFHVVEIQSNQQEQEYGCQIDALFLVPRVLKKLTYISDKIVHPQEFSYLVELQEGQIVTAQNIKKAVRHLFSKKTVHTLRVHVSYSDRLVDIHIECVGIWTLHAFKIGGILSREHGYQSYYLMNPGDEFDQLKHTISMDRIVEACKMNGHFNATLSSSFIYHEIEKSVTVNAQLEKGKRFTVASIDLAISNDECATPEELLVLRQRMEHLFVRGLVKKPYEKEALRQTARDIKQLLEREGFLHVTIMLDEKIDRVHTCVDLVWHIELHHKRTFSFCGNSFFSSEQLLQIVMKFGKSAWLLPASIVAEEIEHAYKDKGFWHVFLEPQKEIGRYLFLIHEGERALIESVELKNLSHMNERTIIKRCFSSVLKRRYFNQEMMQQSFENMIALYRKHGFLKAKIVTHSYVEGAKKNGYRLVIVMEEGEQYYLDAIIISDQLNISSQRKFDEQFKKKDLIIFDPASLVDQELWLRLHYKNNGYHDVDIKSEITERSNSVAITWHVQSPLHSVYFGKSIVIGNTALPFKHIQNQLNYQYGNLWDQEKLHQSFLGLKGLQIFDAVHVYPDTYVDSDGYKNVLIKVQHDDPYEVRLRGGLELQHVQNYRSFSGISYKIGGAFMAKNPTNSGDLMRIDADFARSHREVVGKYWSPSLFNIPARTLFQGYLIQHDQPGAVGNVNDIYTVTQNGFLWGFSNKKKYIDGNINIGCEWMKTYIETSIASKYTSMLRLAKAINFAPYLLNQTISFFFIEPTIFIDRLDNKLDPQRGTLTIFSLKGMFPFNNDNASYFVRMLVEQSVFMRFPLCVIAARIKFGHIFYRRFDTIMPIERFYLGGSQSLRGYDTDLAPPLGVFIEGDDDDDGTRLVVPRGGKSMINGNIEARIPLVYNMLGVLFHDIGMLSCDRFADFKADNLLQATGFGFRYLTPIGPLRFDIGFRWGNCDLLHRNYAWFLTFGHAF